jgi:hypothetical protein
MIRVTEDMRPDRYVCLSHRWGSPSQMHVTTTQNLAHHKQHGIPLNVLPLSFAHAIQICREIDIMYLWIDSLCILQDDLDDWQMQAAKMGDMYAGGFLTIAAAKAKNSDKGCFSRTEEPYLGTKVIGYPDVLVRRIPSLPVLVSEVRHEEHWPLYSRGWVYQEMELSSRILIYGAQEVMWQCRDENQREGRSDWLGGTSPEQPAQSQNLFAFNPIQQNDRYFEDRWRAIVHRYTLRELTFLRDRLPALAAIAQRVCAVRPNDQYLAGLWRQSIMRDLLWRSWGSGSQKQKSSTAPTWSWASVDCPVYWDIQSGDGSSHFALRNVEVLDIRYRVEGPEYTGDIKEAAIEIRAPIFRLRDLHPLGEGELDAEYLRPLDSFLDAYNLATDVRGHLHVGDTDLLHKHWFHHPVFDIGCYDVSDRFRDVEGTLVLFLGVCDDWIEHQRSMARQQALLIRRTGKKRVFQRIGTLLLSDGNDNELKHTQARILGKRGEKLREALESYVPRTILLV